MVHTGTTKVAAKQEIASQKIPKSIYCCIVESHESTRQRVASAVPTKHKDRIAGKGFTFKTHYNLVQEFIPMPRAMKILDAKAAADKEWKKLETIPAWQLGKSQKQEGGYFSKHKETKKVRFDTLMDICHLKNAELEPKLQNTKAESCSVVRQ